MKRLIVNGDDFGFTGGVNAGIIEAFKRGILTSTTILANGDAFEEAVSLAKLNNGLSIGVHLAAIGGQAILAPAEIPTLVDQQGRLPGSLSELLRKIAQGSLRSEDVEREFCAQLHRVVEAGVSPTHLDTHKHSHTQPLIMQALARAGCEFGIKKVRNPFETLASGFSWGPGIRSRPVAYLKQIALSLAVAPRSTGFKTSARAAGFRWPDQFFGVSLTGLLDTSGIRAIMRSMKEGTAELMCHPGFYDEDLEHAPTRLKREREQELEALTDPTLKDFARQNDIELIDYDKL